MKKKLIVTLVISLVFTFKLFAHCEVPCGIYGDELRIKMIKEHISTIEKSINQIVKLQDEKNINYNQLIRWVNTKEKHAEEIQTIISKYFLTQRIKPDADHYENKLKKLHSILIFSMKTKQSLELDNVEKLKNVVEEFSKLYFDPKHTHDHKHSHDHKH